MTIPALIAPERPRGGKTGGQPCAGNLPARLTPENTGTVENFGAGKLLTAEDCRRIAAGRGDTADHVMDIFRELR